MILKIREGHGWHVIDNIKRIYYIEKTLDDGIPKRCCESHIRFITYELRDFYLLAVLTYKNQVLEESVETNLPTYLCNDKGEEIKKIF